MAQTPRPGLRAASGGTLCILINEWPALVHSKIDQKPLMMNRLVEQMKSDWDRRAEQDAHYYVAFSHKNQDLEGFLASANDAIRRIRQEFIRLSHQRESGGPSLLEIGCGVGRLIYFLCKDASSITGVDISGEMISRARALLKGIDNVSLYALEDNNLSCIPDESIDFIYSYAVFQHLPSRELMFRYFDEARRVIRPNGIFTFQINTTATLDDDVDTWVGEWVPSDQVTGRLETGGWRILSIEGRDTQYTWITAAPKIPGMDAAVEGVQARIGDVHGANAPDPVVISGGPLGYLTTYIHGIPEWMCDIAELRCAIGGKAASIAYIGPGDENTWRQFNIWLPEGLGTGSHFMSLSWRGRTLGEPREVSVKARPPLSPRVVRIADGEEIGLEHEVRSDVVQITVDELVNPDDVEVHIAGIALKRRYLLRMEPLGPQWIMSFEIEPVPAGVSQIVVLVAGVEVYRSSITIA